MRKEQTTRVFKSDAWAEPRLDIDILNGFAMVAATRRAVPFFDLWAVASKSAMDKDALRQLAVERFPR